MSESDPAVQFAAQHLGGRTMPDDLRKLLNLQWHNAARESPDGLNGVGVTFLNSDRLPALIDAECAGRDDWRESLVSLMRKRWLISLSTVAQKPFW